MTPEQKIKQLERQLAAKEELLKDAAAEYSRQHSEILKLRTRVDDLESEVNELQEDLNARAAFTEDELDALRDLYEEVRNMVRECGDQYRLRRAFYQVQACTNDPFVLMF